MPVCGICKPREVNSIQNAVSILERSWQAWSWRSRWMRLRPVQTVRQSYFQWIGGDGPRQYQTLRRLSAQCEGVETQKAKTIGGWWRSKLCLTFLVFCTMLGHCNAAACSSLITHFIHGWWCAGSFSVNFCTSTLLRYISSFVSVRFFMLCFLSGNHLKT